MPGYRLIIGDKNKSSWSLRAWLLLCHFELPFEEVLIPLDQPDSTDRIREFSPAGRVPILQSGTETIWDSLAIIEFLAERHPELSIWPADAEMRARARVLAAEMHAGFASMRDELSFNCQLGLPLPVLSAEARSDVERIRDIWRGALQQRPSGEDFLFGAFSAADAMFAPVAVRFDRHGVALDDDCRRYVDALLRLPAMQAWIADADGEVRRLR
jgi:glutathione S-transferase